MIFQRKTLYITMHFQDKSNFMCIIKIATNNMIISGDLFGMWEDVLYCRLHFELVAASYGPHGEQLDLHPALQSPAGSHTTLSPSQDFTDPSISDMYPGFGPPHPAMLGHPPGFPGPPDHWPYGPGPDFGPMPDYQFNNNNEPIKKRRGRKKRKVDDFAAMNGYMEVGNRYTHNSRLMSRK